MEANVTTGDQSATSDLVWVSDNSEVLFKVTHTDQIVLKGEVLATKPGIYTFLKPHIAV